MHISTRSILVGLVLGLTSCLAWSVQQKGQSAPNLLTSPAPTVIQRGGMVEVFDKKNRVMVVERQKYVLPAGELIVHGTTSSANEIKPGTKIKFNTSKENYSGQEQVKEIWIMATDPTRK